VQHSTAQHSTTQHAQHSTAQHSTATAQDNTAQASQRSEFLGNYSGMACLGGEILDDHRGGGMAGQGEFLENYAVLAPP